MSMDSSKPPVPPGTPSQAFRITPFARTSLMRSTASTRALSNHLLRNLPEPELDQLRPHLVPVRLVADQVLIESGHAAEHVFFIEDGIALLMAQTEQGKLGVQVAMIGREGMVGGLSLLDGGSAAYASGVMRIPGSALRIPAAELRRIFDNSPALREVIMRYVQSLTRQIMSAAAWNASNTLVERCVRWVLMAHERVDGDDLPITHEALSVMLGVRRSGVTVATAALHRAGLIRTSRGRIRVLDRAGLEQMLQGGKRLGRSGLAAVVLLLLTLTSCAPGSDLSPIEEYTVTHYRLGAGDQVRIITFGEDQLTGDFRVDDQGSIALPLLGSVPAAGKTTQELDAAIGEGLRNRKLLRDASVSSEVLAYRPIFVLGEVAKPGQYPFQPGMTMLTAVAVAGGFTYRGVEDYADVIRTTDAHKAVEGRIVPNSFIAPGDVIKVFQRRF